MADRKIEPTYGVEAYINTRRAIVLKQYDPALEENIFVVIELRDIETVCQWLAELAEEAAQLEDEE